MSPAVLLRILIGALVVAVLIVGTLLLRNHAEAPLSDPGSYVKQFYDNKDVSGMLDAFPSGSLGDAQESDAGQALGQILQPGVDVKSTATKTVDGVRIAQVVMGDRLEWCVRPDGKILADCKLGSVEVTPHTDAKALDVSIGLADVLYDGGRLQVGIQNTSDQPFTFGGGITIHKADGSDSLFHPRQSMMSQDGKPVPAPLDDDLTLEAGGSLFLAFESDQPWPAGNDLTLTWNDGRIDLNVGSVDWFVR